MPSAAETVSYGLGRNRSITLHFSACFALLLLFFSFYYFYFKGWDANHLSSIVLGNILVSLKASIIRHGSGTGLGSWKVKYLKDLPVSNNRRMQTLLLNLPIKL